MGFLSYTVILQWNIFLGMWIPKWNRGMHGNRRVMEMLKNGSCTKTLVDRLLHVLSPAEQRADLLSDTRSSVII